jgi:hypothetical protein
VAVSGMVRNEIGTHGRSETVVMQGLLRSNSISNMYLRL